MAEMFSETNLHKQYHYSCNQYHYKYNYNFPYCLHMSNQMDKNLLVSIHQYLNYRNKNFISYKQLNIVDYLFYCSFSIKKHLFTLTYFYKKNNIVCLKFVKTNSVYTILYISYVSTNNNLLNN